MITDQMLAEAAAELNIAMLNSLPDASECAHQFSAKFERKMRRVIRKGNHPVRYRIVQRVASIILVLFVSLMTLLAISPTVRAAVFAWIRERYDYYAHYYFTSSAYHNTNPAKYELSYVPSGYNEVKRIELPGNTSIFYEQNTTKQTIHFTYSTNHHGTEYFYELVDYKVENITVNGENMEYLQSNNPEIANIIQWSSSKTNTFFCISAFLDKSELVKIAENIKIL